MHTSRSNLYVLGTKNVEVVSNDDKTVHNYHIYISIYMTFGAPCITHSIALLLLLLSEHDYVLCVCMIALRIANTRVITLYPILLEHIHTTGHPDACACLQHTRYPLAWQ